jgi:hypothetical protein
VSERVGKHRIRELNQDLEQLGITYGLGENADKIDAMTAAAASCRNRAARLRSRAAGLVDEAVSLEDEAYGRERILEAFLVDLVQSCEPAGAMWSPTPVLGYRMWAFHQGRLRGAREVWTKPTLEATCSKPGRPGDVPHADGRCGRLGCGIYAGKDLHRLVATPAFRFGSAGFGTDPSLAIGLVELTGKVIEHDLGYRAQCGTVVAVVAGHNGTQLATADPNEIAALFADPVAAVARHDEEKRERGVLDVAVDFLTQQAKERARWTLGNRSE